MKYMYSTVFFLIFIFFITTVIDFNYVQEVENIDMSDNNIDKIDIDFIDANVSLSTTVDKDIKIEHIYSKESQPTSNLYTYQEGDTLYVNEYPYNSPNFISKKETINIYIPEEYVFDELNIKTTSGQINVDSLSTDDLNIKTDSGNVDVANVSTTNMRINGGQLGVRLSNVVAKEFSSNIDKVEMQIANSIIDDAEITNKADSSIRIDKLVTNYVMIDGANTDVDLTLNDKLDYAVKTPVVVGNPQLATTDSGYEYIANKGEAETRYSIPHAKSVTVKLESIDGETSGNE